MIEPVLDVWYFMLSTTMCAAKLLLAFISASRSSPGYIERDVDLEWEEVVSKVDSKHLCAYCKVIKTRSSHHCHLCNKCVDRYEGHCTWTDNCIGRKNNNSYFAFIFYVWLVVFLVGWTSYSTVGILECETLPDKECIYHSLCVGCNNPLWHYLVCYGTALVSLFVFFPSGWLCCVQWCNYGKGTTTHERFARQQRTSSMVSGDASERGDSIASLADLKDAVAEESKAT